MLKRSQICIVVFLLTCFYSCKHDIEDVRGCGEFTTYYDSKAFCSFNVGTYRVYENEITLERDTFTVYEHFVILDGDKEVGYFTRMSRTFENADFAFYQEETQNGSWLNDRCEKRRVWMSRTDYQDNGQVNSIQNSNFFLPLYTDLSFNSWCLDLGDGDDLNFVEDISDVEILNFSTVNTFTISGPSFSLNPCEGHRYRYQMGQGIGLISWENLDLMDGKWRLIEFAPQ